MKRWLCLLIIIVVLTCGLSACKKPSEPVETPTYSLSIDAKTTYQTLDGFGASGAWWAQYVGGIDNKIDGTELRDYVVKLLYDPKEGIGLDIYRYNLGAGVTEDEGAYSHGWRRAESFLTEDGSYDFTRDSNAQWMMRRAVEYGATEVVLFCNSPPNSMTVNGKAQSTEGVPNLAPERYADFADYCFDIAEHFLSEGLPVTAISPVNEPQWAWSGGQEGCHYETDELIALYKVFFEELTKRPLLSGVRISLPESGHWGDNTLEYLDAFLADEELAANITAFDAHSYWTDYSTKGIFKAAADLSAPWLELVTSEWCIMEPARDLGMSSAIKLAHCISEDLSVLSVTSWNFWLAVSCYDYKDGLIYFNSDEEIPSPAKMLYSFGNFSKYIKRGATRIECELNSDAETEGMLPEQTAYINPDGELVVVIVNDGEEIELDISSITGYAMLETIVTAPGFNLESTYVGKKVGTVIIGADSVTTLVFSIAVI